MDRAGDDGGLARRARRRRGAPGKLTAAATAWAWAFLGLAAPDRATDDEAAADLRAWGVPEDQIAAALGPAIGEDDAVAVWAVNWQSVQLFLLAETLWRPLVLASMAGARIAWSGLDYVGLDVLMRRLAIDDPGGKLFGDLLHMEAAALTILNRPREG